MWYISYGDQFENWIQKTLGLLDRGLLVQWHFLSPLPCGTAAFGPWYDRLLQSGLVYCSRGMCDHMLGIWPMHCGAEHSSRKFVLPWWLSCWEPHVLDSWLRLWTKCIDSPGFSDVMTDSWAWEDSCDLAISTALSSVSFKPLAISFSLTFSWFRIKYNLVSDHFIGILEVAVLG